MFVTPVKMAVLLNDVAIIATTVFPLDETHLIMVRGLSTKSFT